MTTISIETMSDRELLERIVRRIEGARAGRQFPIILDRAVDGAVTVTTVALLRSHLTPENHRELLTAAWHRTTREVEHQSACLAPTPSCEDPHPASADARSGADCRGCQGGGFTAFIC